MCRQDVCVSLCLAKDGSLWSQDRGSRQVRITDYHFPKLLPQWTTANRIYISALPRNARLITFLYQSKRRDDLGYDLWLVPPSEPRSEDVELLSAPIRQASTGGCRPLTLSDYIVYSLWSQRELNVSYDALIRLAEQHPAWPALSFPAAGNRESGVSLLMHLLDPRWYVDVMKPAASKRLFGCFGLGGPDEGLDNMNHLSGGSKLSARNSRQAGIVLNTWHSGKAESELPGDVIWNDPFYTIYRKSEDGCAGLLKASRVFLKFVCDVWLDNLTSYRTYCVDEEGKKFLEPARSYSPQLFVPEHLFDRDQCREWYKHRSAWLSKVND